MKDEGSLRERHPRLRHERRPRLRCGAFAPSADGALRSTPWLNPLSFNPSAFEVPFAQSHRDRSYVAILGRRRCMNDWHLMRLGQLALSGAALLTIEATAVLPEGRITYADVG